MADYKLYRFYKLVILGSTPRLTINLMQLQRVTSHNGNVFDK